jgi:hypothetical protein
VGSLGPPHRRPLIPRLHRSPPAQPPGSRDRWQGTCPRSPLRVPTNRAYSPSVSSVPPHPLPRWPHSFARLRLVLRARSPLQKKARRLEPTLRVARRQKSDPNILAWHLGNVIVGGSVNLQKCKDASPVLLCDPYILESILMLGGGHAVYSSSVVIVP